jgi:hypothetical protein
MVLEYQALEFVASLPNLLTLTIVGGDPVLTFVFCCSIRNHRTVTL